MRKRKKINTRKIKNIILSLLTALLMYFFYFVFEQINETQLPTSDFPAQLYSNQTQDDLRSIFSKAMDEAKKSITLVIYGLSDPKIISTLRQKAEAGIDVMVVYDHEASKFAGKKLGERVKVIKRESKGLMHQKILIIDNIQTWIGSANMTAESLKMHGNLVLALHSPHVAELALAKVKQMASKVQDVVFLHQSFLLGNQKMELWYLPDDHSAVDRLLKIINEAKKTIRIAMFTWSREDLAQAVIAAHKRGVDVQVVLDQYCGKGASARVAKMLAHAHIPVFFNKGNALLHHKMLYVDSKLLVNGSANWTKAAFTKNDDCFIVLHDLTEEQKGKMEKLWKVIYAETVDLPESYQEAA